MQLRIHAVLLPQGGKLMPRLGSPEDHQLSGEFRPYPVKHPTMQMEIVLWSQTPLTSDDMDTARRWVINNLGFAG